MWLQSNGKDSHVAITSTHKSRAFCRKGYTNASVRHTHDTYNMSSAQNVLRARRGVIRMLIVVVLTFALCNLPYHARKMWQYWSVSYDGGSTFSSLFTPLTFLVTYVNSGVNPLLYALMSRNFRKGMLELLGCSFRGTSRCKETRCQTPLSSMGRSSLKTKAVSVTMTPTPTPST